MDHRVFTHDFSNNTTNPATRAEIMVNTASAGGAGTLLPANWRRSSVLASALPGVSAPRGTLPTSLGGVSVTFDGAAVPIAYRRLFAWMCKRR